MRRERAFTLIELMIVIAIIGVLAAIAVTSIDPRPRADDAAQVIAQQAREAGREAVSRGEVRADVALSLGSARSRMLVTASGATITVTVEILVEEDLPSDGGSWVEVGRRTVDGATIGGFSTSAVLTDGITPEQSLGADPIELRCSSDGACDGLTIYFQGRGDERARVVIMPLGGEAMIFYTW